VELHQLPGIAAPDGAQMQRRAIGDLDVGL
jgi:hypothetical protein